MSDKPHSLDCSYSNWQAAVRRAEKAEAESRELRELTASLMAEKRRAVNERDAAQARLAEVEKERDDLKCCNVRYWDEIQNVTRARDKRGAERDAAQARVRELEAAIVWTRKRYKAEGKENTPADHELAKVLSPPKLLTPPALPLPLEKP